MWRLAVPNDDDRLVEMCLGLYRDDPSSRPVAAEQMRRTMAVLRSEPQRGRAVVLEVDGQAIGYALLIAFTFDYKNPDGSPRFPKSQTCRAPRQETQAACEGP